MMLSLSPQIQQYDPLDVIRQQNVAQGGRLTNQTALITLEDLKRQQASAARLRQALQQDPALVLGGGGGGGPLLASPALTAGGPMTQQAFGPGGMGPTQQVPGGQDLSRYAGVSPQGGGPIPPEVAAQVLPTVTPPGGPQSTLAGLAPPPRQDPLEALFRTDPDAGLKLLDMRTKLQTQRLETGEKIAGSIGRIAQGVNDQASLDQAREEIGQIDPRAAAQLPKFYSKAAMEPFIQRALDVKTSQELKIKDLNAQAEAVKAQADVMKARMSGRVATTDQYLKALGVAPGQETAEDMQKAIAWQQQDEMSKSAAHGTGQIVQTPQGFMRINPRTNQPEQIQAPGGGPLYPKPTAEEQRAASYASRAKAAHDNAVALEEKGLTPGIWSKVGEALPFGLGNYLVGEDQQRYRQAVSQFAQALLRKESGAAISPTEYTMTETTYFPQPGNSKKVIEDKRRERERIVQEMQEEGKQTGRPGTQSPPASQGTTGTSGQTPLKPVGEMSRDELLAERDRLRKGGG
jgi:hypothetical protein